MNHDPHDQPKGKKPLHISEAKIKTLEVSEAEDTHRLRMSDPRVKPPTPGPPGDPPAGPGSPSYTADPSANPASIGPSSGSPIPA
jgi:hypothetical protein